MTSKSSSGPSVCVCQFSTKWFCFVIVVIFHSTIHLIQWLNPCLPICFKSKSKRFSNWLWRWIGKNDPFDRIIMIENDRANNWHLKSFDYLFIRSLGFRFLLTNSTFKPEIKFKLGEDIILPCFNYNRVSQNGQVRNWQKSGRSID